MTFLVVVARSSGVPGMVVAVLAFTALLGFCAVQSFRELQERFEVRRREDEFVRVYDQERGEL